MAVQSRQNGKVVAYFTIELLSLADYLFKKVFFPFQAISKCTSIVLTITWLLIKVAASDHMLGLRYSLCIAEFM